MSGKFQKRPFMNLPVPFERDHRPVLRDSWRDFSAHFERTSIHWKRKVTHSRATYAATQKLMNKLQFTIEDADLEALLQKDAVESGTP